MRLISGLLPALITPFTEGGEIDLPSVARLLARAESAGCFGAVVGGTNGESPSLSAVEKRDLVRAACATAGKLKIVAGLGTESIPEALWLAEQARKAGAVAALVMPPRFWQPCDPLGIQNWFRAVLDQSPLPILIYHFPKRSGFDAAPQWYTPLLDHPNCAGLKDSSGQRENLAVFAQLARTDQSLLVGDERLIVPALAEGWAGSISGLGNAIPHALTRLVNDPNDDAWAALLEPLINDLKGLAQPAHHKQLLHELGVISTPTLRPPLLPAEPGIASNLIRRTLGEPR